MRKPDGGAPAVSLIVPCKNEADILDVLLARLVPVLEGTGESFEIVYVNDGSTDATLERMREQQGADVRIAILDLSRNFGKDAALTAGIAEARGDAVVVVDADLQDPPEVIPEMIARWREGADIVVAQRSSRDADTRSRRLMNQVFYRLFNLLSDFPIPNEAGEFRLLNRRAADTFLQLGERARFSRGLFSWLGFRQEFVAHPRPASTRDDSRFTWFQMLRMALDGVTSFSSLPIRIWSLIGGAVAAVSLLYGLALIASTLIFGRDVPGYASIMVAVLFLGGLNLLSIGLLGEYIGRVLIEGKRRPLYVINARYPAQTKKPAAPRKKKKTPR